MAVFGVPVAHEDHALRAVRAAAEMRESLPELGVQARIGVMTGEVVTGTEERLVTGRRGQCGRAARAGGEAGRGADRGADARACSRAQPRSSRVEPLVLKGKAEPVAAYRLLRMREAPERRHETPFVGRDARARHSSRRLGSPSSPSAAASWSRSSEMPASASRGSPPSSSSGRCDRRPRPLSPLRRGDHLLARGRGAEAARRGARRRGRRGLDPLPARRDAKR